MFEIDSKTYKYLKSLGGFNDWVVKSQTNEFEIKLLYYNRLIDNESEKTQKYKINEAGKRFIKDHRKKTIEKWVLWSVVTIIALGSAIIGLLSLLG